MTRPPAYHPGNFLMKNMNPTNSGLTKLVSYIIYCILYTTGANWFPNEHSVNSDCGIVPEHLWSENI